MVFGAYLIHYICTGGAISKKLSLNVLSDSTTQDLYRGIRTQLASLLGEMEVDEKDIATMSLGLSHSLSRSVV